MILTLIVVFGWWCADADVDMTPLGERHEASIARRRVVLSQNITVAVHIRRARLGGCASRRACSPAMVGVLGRFTAQFGRDLLDVVAPRDCLSCSAPGRTLCARCTAVVLASRPLVDHRRVGRPMLMGGWLEGALGAAVRGYKSGAGRGLARPLSVVLAAAIEELLVGEGSPPDIASGELGCRLVAVPPSLRARWTRGDDVLGNVVDLAGAALRRRGLAADRVRWLEPARLVRDQRGLGARSRRLNVEGSLRVRPGAHGAVRAGNPPVIVVDDVVTTGATLREAIRALTQGAQGAGAGSVAGCGPIILGAAVIAATRDHHPHHHPNTS